MNHSTMLDLLLSDAGSIEVIPESSKIYYGTENESMEVLCRVEQAMPIPTIHLYEVLENGQSEINRGDPTTNKLH